MSLHAGDGQEAIYLDDEDRTLFLEVLGEACKSYNFLVHSWCQMTNHYHLLIETPDRNLSKGMRHLNGVYTQRFNKKQHRAGHLFQGRFKAILVEKEIADYYGLHYSTISHIENTMQNESPGPVLCVFCYVNQIRRERE